MEVFMRKKICCFICFFIVTICFADEYVISKIECVETQNLYDRELTLKYDDEDNVFYLFRSTYSRSYWFTLNPSKLEQLRQNLIKTQEWGKLAKDNKSSIKKEIPNSVIKVSGTMKSGNDWYTTYKDIPLKFFFVSSFSDDFEIVSLMLVGDEQESKQNQFIDIEFESVLFLNSEIDDFANAISKETVDNAIKKHTEEKQAADIFK